MADDAPTTAVLAELKPNESSGDAAKPDATAQPAGDSATANTSDDTQPNGDTGKDVDSAGDASGAVAAEASNDATQATNGSDTPAVNGTPAPKKGKDKRKSGIPEHKKSKTPLSKKKQLTLHLDAEPGQLWFAHMKGHQPWPAIICDEDMLPETLLSKRPVSAVRLDGTYREDFMEGGKSARDRRYPIMFLGTNEFSWQVNTDLSPLDMEKVKEIAASGDKGKKSQQLFDAYEVAAEEHDLAWFKDMLRDHQEAIRADQEEKEAKKAAKEEKKEQKARRKSEKNDDEDVEMEDADDSGAKKSKSKKRKKEADETDGDEATNKTPGKKLKVNGPKTPAEPSAKKPAKKSAKKEKKTSDQEDTPVVEENPMTEAEKREKKQKTILYLRHRLQKGFLGRDTKPQEGEMEQMQTHFTSLETHHDLEPEIIRNTKIHKVLKGIVRLDSIPRDEEFKFKSRAEELLGIWNKALASETDTPVPGATTNGVSPVEKTTDSKAPDADKPEEKQEKTKDEDDDVAMSEAKEPAVAEASKEEKPSAESPESAAVAT